MGWAGLSQGAPLSQLHSQHAQPPGKLAEAVRLRLDPETPQLPDLHDASESRQSYHHQERIAEPLAKPRQPADRPDDWTTPMAKDGTQAPLSLGVWCHAPEATSPSVWYSLPGLK
jgi:hypothetical protein